MCVIFLCVDNSYEVEVILIVIIRFDVIEIKAPPATSVKLEDQENLVKSTHVGGRHRLPWFDLLEHCPIAGIVVFTTYVGRYDPM